VSEAPDMAAYLPVLYFALVAGAIPVLGLLIMALFRPSRPNPTKLSPFPWAVMYDRLLLFGLVEMIVFLYILVVGYVYVWKRGALSWA
jgi:NADH:ubiquinone oxidoreductase subunit 3 (subunit A)